MAKDLIGYEALADRALRSVVKEALKRTEKQGLLGSHHFYLTFRTKAPGVEIPDFLIERYPEEMTIVLQNQFWGLAVDEESFAVQLKFGGRLERLTVPFAALVAFADPSVPFGLRFEESESEAEAEPAVAAPLPADRPAASAVTAVSEKGDAKVVAFRARPKKAGPEPRDS